MKKHIKTLGFFALCILALSSCKKAGTDGDATVVVFAKHHGVIIPNDSLHPDSVFVFFNEKDLPTDPTNNYDALFVGEAGEDHVHCEHLHTGTYFIYATGWDNNINARVKGGVSIKIRYKDRKKEIDQDVPVTED